MQNFIGLPLSQVIEYCKKNNLEYEIIINSYSQDECTEFFVTNMRMKNNLIEITVSKFKIEV